MPRRPPQPIRTTSRRACAQVVRIARAGWLKARELRGHGLADDDTAGAANEGHHGGIRSRTMSGVNREPLGWEIGRVVDVLDADRQATQRQGRQPLSALARSLDIQRHERADLGVALGDGIGTTSMTARGECASFDLPDKLERGLASRFPVKPRNDAIGQATGARHDRERGRGRDRPGDRIGLDPLD